MQTKISAAAVCRPQKNHALQSWDLPKAFNPKAKSFESNPDSDLNVCQASILWKLGTHLNPNLSPAKSVSGKPPKSFMSISFDSPSQSQVPNLIQYCSWDAVTAHSKRARIHIWRKVWKILSGRNFVNFIADGRPGKVFLHPTFTVVRAFRWWPSQRAIKKIYIVYFLEFILKMIFIIIFVFFAVVLKISIGDWDFFPPKKLTFGWVFNAQQGLFTGYNFD